MNTAERAALLEALKRATGEVDSDAADLAAAANPDALAGSKRPTREKIKAIARDLARRSSRGGDSQ
jgi:hypothetical protein